VNPTDLLNASAASGPGLAPQLKILAVLTLLSLLPAIVLTMTSFTRIVVVLGFVKQGIGSQQAPPSQVLVGLALFMTLFVMAPVVQKVNDEALQPYLAGKLDESGALAAATPPLRGFLLAHTRQEDLALFTDAAHMPRPQTPADVPLKVAVPAFVISELQTAFQMGLLILLPFLVIDVVVATVLSSMGMVMLPPASISLPIKLLVFVSVDGWHLIVSSLLKGILS
jgi:flagellar biosynthesis protein FliP